MHDHIVGEQVHFDPGTARFSGKLILLTQVPPTLVQAGVSKQAQLHAGRPEISRCRTRGQSEESKILQLPTRLFFCR